MMKEPNFSTAFLIVLQYGGKSIIPVDDVCRDYFSHLSPVKFLLKISQGEIKIPIVRVEDSQKCQKGVHLQDLAVYIDERRDAALKEFRQLYRG